VHDEFCLSCQLTTGEIDLPGGQIYATDGWIVEHCIGPLPVGTLILKPRRHVEHLWQLTGDEAAELGPLISRFTGLVRHLTDAGQVFACLWAFKDWRPGHVHFVLQPAWATQSDEFKGSGPMMQSEMFLIDDMPARRDIEEFADRARAALSEAT
jgi:diadenosine tetraphosphate (Ap4A) HIT family hydrolase